MERLEKTVNSIGESIERSNADRAIQPLREAQIELNNKIARIDERQQIYIGRIEKNTDLIQGMNEKFASVIPAEDIRKMSVDLRLLQQEFESYKEKVQAIEKRVGVATTVADHIDKLDKKIDTLEAAKDKAQGGWKAIVAVAALVGFVVSSVVSYIGDRVVIENNTKQTMTTKQ